VAFGEASPFGVWGVPKGRNFYTQAQAMESPHMISRAERFANELMQTYKDVQAVRDLDDEIHTSKEESS